MRVQAAAIRSEIETKLSARIPSALSPLEQQAPRLLPIGDADLNGLLDGGLPLGSLCEVTGREGAGLTSIALSVLAFASQEAACAYVDVSDTLSPHCAASAGVDLSNLLWVRFAQGSLEQSRTQTLNTSELPLDNRREKVQLAQQNCGGPHPRGETKNLAPALEQMLARKQERRLKKQEGTPGYPNQPLGLHTASQEQVDWERFNLRRIDDSDPLRQMDRASAIAARERAMVSNAASARSRTSEKPWNRLDGALRATDQILQAGGFRVVVLDLGSLPEEQSLRIPSATWWRFQKAAQKSDAIFLLLTQQPCARSSAACVLQCSPQAKVKMQGVLTEITRTVEIARQRTAPLLRKKAPGRVTSWQAVPQWMRTAGE